MIDSLVGNFLLVISESESHILRGLLLSLVTIYVNSDIKCLTHGGGSPLSSTAIVPWAMLSSIVKITGDSIQTSVQRLQKLSKETCKLTEIYNF